MKFWKKLENLFAATAFAEEGEFETARQMAGEKGPEAALETTGVAEHEGTGKAERVSQRKRSRISRSRAA